MSGQKKGRKYKLTSGAIREREKNASVWVKQKVKITNKNTIVILKCVMAKTGSSAGAFPKLVQNLNKKIL